MVFYFYSLNPIPTTPPLISSYPKKKIPSTEHLASSTKIWPLNPQKSGQQGSQAK